MALNSLQGIYPSVSIDTISDSMSFNRSDHSGNATDAHTAESVCVVTNIGTHILYLVYDMGTHFFRFFYCF